MVTTKKPDMLLWLSAARGVYIPRDFAKSFADRAKDVSGVSDEDWEVLEAGPDHESYWEIWYALLNNCEVRDDKANITYRVFQDGDCWLIPEGMEWSDSEETFVWPEEESEEEEIADEIIPR